MKYKEDAWNTGRMRAKRSMKHSFDSVFCVDNDVWQVAIYTQLSCTEQHTAKLINEEARELTKPLLLGVWVWKVWFILCSPESRLMKQPDQQSRKCAQDAASFLAIPSNRTPDGKSLTGRHTCWCLMGIPCTFHQVAVSFRILRQTEASYCLLILSSWPLLSC
jgi:hypothetical protein